MHQELPAMDQAPAPLTDRKAIVAACVSSHWDEVESALMGLGFGPWTVTKPNGTESGGWATGETVHFALRKLCPWNHEQATAPVKPVWMEGMIEEQRQYLYFLVSPCCGRWEAVGRTVYLLGDKRVPKATA